MRTVKRTAQFRRDFKRAKRGVHGRHLDATLLEVLELLVADVPLPSRYVDHPMEGEYVVSSRSASPSVGRASVERA